MNWIDRLKRRFQAACHESEVRAAYAEDRLGDALSHARALYQFDLDNVWANFMLACHHLDADRYAEALPHLERLAADWPDDAWTHYAVGVCHDQLDHLRDAVAAYRRTLALDPEWARPLKYLGNDLYLLGDYAAAEDAISRYCLAAPNDKEAHDLLGYLLYRQGKFHESYGHYERARRLDPLNPKIERNARRLYRRSARC